MAGRSSKKLGIAAGILIVAMQLTPASALSQEFAKPAGDVILTATGDISVTNADGALMLDKDQLASLPQHSFTTSTTWTEGTATFQGVLLKDLIKDLGAKGTTIKLTALNDYEIEIPLADIHEDGPMLAYLMDGKPMSVRDKGPIWLVYPYDSNASYRSEQTYARSIWQLDRIEFAE